MSHEAFQGIHASVPSFHSARTAELVGKAASRTDSENAKRTSLVSSMANKRFLYLQTCTVADTVNGYRPSSANTTALGVASLTPTSRRKELRCTRSN